MGVWLYVCIIMLLCMISTSVPLKPVSTGGAPGGLGRGQSCLHGVSRTTESIHHHHHHPEGVVYTSFCLHSGALAASRIASRRWWRIESLLPVPCIVLYTHRCKRLQPPIRAAAGSMWRRDPHAMHTNTVTKQ